MAKHRDVPALPTSGSFGAPPANAPHEVSQPLSEAAISEMLEKAQANEQELKPLVFNKPPLVSPAPAPAAPSSSTKAASLKPSDSVSLEGTGATEPEASSDQDQAPASLDQVQEAFNALPHQPAASDTDSPSRGVPRVLDPGKQITGGWGLEPAQYYALDGSELKTLIRELWKKIDKTLDEDLRFMMAVTYPQVRAKVSITIDGASADAAINDVKFSLEQARLVTIEEIRTDDQDTPADSLRDEAGVVRPRKQLVQTGAGRQYADVLVK